MFILDCTACQVLMTPLIQAKLGPKLTSLVETHLAACPRCQAEYARLILLSQILIDTMEALPAAPERIWTQLESAIAPNETDRIYELVEASVYLFAASGVPRGGLIPLLHGLRLVRRFA